MAVISTSSSVVSSASVVSHISQSMSALSAVTVQVCRHLLLLELLVVTAQLTMVPR